MNDEDHEDPAAAAVTPAVRLSDRQMVALRLAARGCSETGSAKKLGLRLEVVRYDRKVLRRRLRSSTMAGAVGRAFALGLLTGDDLGDDKGMPA